MRFLLALVVTLYPLSVFAQTPVPSAHPSKDLEIQKQQNEAETKSLQKEMKDIKTELQSKKKSLISVARDIKSNETRLLKLEGTIAERKKQKHTIEARLAEDRATLSKLVLAMQRIKRLPPEALIARPGAPLKTAQSAMLLQSILPQLYEQADALNNSLEELSDVVTSLEKDRNAALSTAKQLQVNQSKLNSLLNERERLYAKTEKNISRNKLELARISKQAKNLRELVARIEKKQEREEQQRLRAKKENIQPASIKTPLPRAGSPQLPLSGSILTSYGKTDDIGAVSQGIKIQGRFKALVVAPMGGVIDYAGPFKGYGQIVIIRHQKNYHSLVAGLAKIDTVVGRAVNVGEPIGRMGSEEGATSLYYELRYKGQPVNPSKKIPGL
ncbi:MAG: peptidoglycan DD-metalloendopeptidase family protein [Pseudomonadota bacterium]